jgi:hypothetical protein
VLVSSLVTRRGSTCERAKISPYGFHDFVTFAAIKRKVHDNGRMHVL